MQSTIKKGDLVKIYGFGLVDNDERITGLFSGETGRIEEVDEDMMCDVRLDNGGELAKVHSIQVVPVEKIS